MENPFIKKSDSLLNHLWSPLTVQLISSAIFGAFPSILSPGLRVVPFLSPAADLVDAADGFILRIIIIAVGFVIGLGITQLMSWVQFWIMGALLANLNWIYQPKTLNTKIWALLIKFFRGPGPFSTFYFQRFMPRQPLPDLDETLDRYLKVTKPLVGDAEYEMTKQAVEAFRMKDGPIAQAYLLKRRSKTLNWLAEYWLGAAYLSSRKPLTVYSNYYMGNAGFEGNSTDMLVRSSVITHLFLMYHDAIVKGKIEPAMLMDTVPLCMSGFRFLFNVTRVPGEHIDAIETYSDKRHIIVIRKKKYFSIEGHATNKNGSKSPLTPEELKMQFEKIIEMADDETKGTNIAALTSQDRYTWAKQRQILMKNKINKATLAKVESAMFLVVLDEGCPKDLHELNKLGLVGRGGDRWFDKSFTQCFYTNGDHGGTMEHTVTDATIFGRMSEDINIAELKMYNHGDLIIDPARPPRQLALPERLQWDTDEINGMIDDAMEKFHTLADDIDAYVLNAVYGKGVMKKCRVSPDGFIQMAMQLAYYRANKTVCRTYEPSTGRIFLLGRTECLHPVSEYSKKWLLAMDDPKVDKRITMSLLKKAIQEQSSSRLDATAGKGCDRHLLGLYCACRELGMDIPRIFTDEAWRQDYKLSTSQTPNQLKERGAKLMWDSVNGGFGPYCHDGYGISYLVVGDDVLNFQITSWKSCSTTSSAGFAQSITKAMEDMKELMLG